MELSNEQKLVVLLSRLTFSQECIEEIKNNIEKKINWLEFINLAIINKIVGLAYFNLNNFGLLSKIPLNIYQIMKFYYLGNKERNNIYMKEKQLIKEGMDNSGVNCFPLKGAYLISTIYQDLGSRAISDLDFLIDIEQVDNVINVMKTLGYQQGKYDRDKKEIKGLSRQREVMWKIKMNNLPSYIKIYNSENVEYIATDFSFSLDLDKDIKPVKEMITNSKNGILQDEFFLIHLCCHLYKEATGAIWILLNADNNLIKFCDCREYILNFMKEESIERMLEFAKQHNLLKSIYFVIYYLKLIYNDGYEDNILSKINVKDTDFVNYFGKNDFEKESKWKKSFWERIFSYSNQEDLAENEEFVENFSTYNNL